MRSISGTARSFAVSLFSTTILTTGAQAAVVISSDATQNMSCAGGVCAPTAKDAVLNVTDLENALATGDVEVTTTGSGVQAKNVSVSAAVSWNSPNTLALDASGSIKIGATIADGGSGGLSLAANDSGREPHITYDGGNITFAVLSSSLTINGKPYQLADSVSSLASDIAAGPNGKYALANSYDAGGDGTYSTDPIQTVFGGIFDGLGNSISNLSINTNGDSGMFYEITTSGEIQNIALVDVSISANSDWAGSLVTSLAGTMSSCSASGTVGGAANAVGGLVGENSGIITQSLSTATVNGSIYVGGLVAVNNATIRSSSAAGAVDGLNQVGGLVGTNGAGGFIDHSHASGAVTISGDSGTTGGGLVGLNNGWVLNSYATGTISAASYSFVGGFVGEDSGSARIDRSFAKGDVNGGAGSKVGAFVGGEGGDIENSYATGVTSAEDSSSLGGFVGCIGTCVSLDGGAVLRHDYSIGKVTSAKQSALGGFVGLDGTSGGIRDSYWDTKTSHQEYGTGNRGNEPGLKGRTTAQLQSGLPAGFSSRIWVEDAQINNGFPYLKANPPPN